MNPILDNMTNQGYVDPNEKWHLGGLEIEFNENNDITLRDVILKNLAQKGKYFFPKYREFAESLPDNILQKKIHELGGTDYPLNRSQMIDAFSERISSKFLGYENLQTSFSEYRDLTPLAIGINGNTLSFAKVMEDQKVLDTILSQDDKVFHNVEYFDDPDTSTGSTRCFQIPDSTDKYMNLQFTEDDIIQCDIITSIKLDGSSTTITNGSYTYMLIYTDGEFIMYLAEEMPSEFGTKHFCIFNLIRQQHPDAYIAIAGELQVTDNVIKFNFESGTYSQYNMTPLLLMGGKPKEEGEDIIFNRLLETWWKPMIKYFFWKSKIEKDVEYTSDVMIGEKEWTSDILNEMCEDQTLKPRMSVYSTYDCSDDPVENYCD